MNCIPVFLGLGPAHPDCEYTSNLYVSLHSDAAVCFIMVAEFLEMLLHFLPALFGAGKPLKICCLILLI